MTSTHDSKLADVCIIGLGYVGLTLATAFSLAGLRVVGFERDRHIVEQISAGSSPFHEDGLDAAVQRVTSEGLLSAVDTNASLPLAKSYVITVGTPLRHGDVWLKDLEDALARVSEGMPESALVVLRSTVRVGTTRRLALATLAASGKQFFLAMAPERTIEGRALSELRTLPQIVGGIDDRSTEAAAALFEGLGVDIVRVGTVEAAELAKLSSNTYRDLQFAFANELAYLADTMGVDVFDVINACNHGYERMSLALPGPVAGPCLEKDAYILAASARQYGTEAALSMTGRRTNEAMVGHVGGILLNALEASPARIAILGIAFKGRPATSDVRGSMAREFAADFRGRWTDVSIVGWDPLVSAADAALIGVESMELEDSVRHAQVVLIQTNHLFFSTAEFTESLSRALMPDAIVFDLWNQVPPELAGRSDVRVLTLGRSKVGAS